MKKINKVYCIQETAGLMSLLFLFGCASTQNKTVCPDITAEPVSSCRAEEKCKQKKESYGFGLGLGIGSNLGMSESESQNTENYTKCVERDMAEQRAVNQVEESKEQSREPTNETEK